MEGSWRPYMKSESHLSQGKLIHVSGRVVLASLFLLSVLGFLGGNGPSSVQGAELGTVSTTATLSILAGLVKRVPAGSDKVHRAKDGMDLAVGDRVLTGSKATALVTFLDGSTLTVQPKSDVEVKRADFGSKGSRIRIKINLGTVWARVVRLFDPNSGLSLESNTATATVHDGLIGGQQKADHTFVCWTLAGDLAVKDRKGRVLVTLQPGEKTLVKGHQASGHQPFAYNQSTLKVTTSPAILPLIVMTDQSRVAGFVTPGVEVNQVFGSFTGMTTEGLYTMEIPAGLPGPFTLILEGQQDTDFTITLEGFFKHHPAYQKKLSVTIRKGERLVTHISQTLDEATAHDPKTARAVNAQVSPFHSFDGPLPGTIFLSPMELQEAGKQSF